MQSEPTQHHPQGPSQLEHFDPRSHGCYAFVSGTDTHEAAEIGSLQHQAWATGDLSILGGDENLRAEVVETAKYFVDLMGTRFRGEEFRETKLFVPHVNWGTADLLKFNPKQTWALVGDAKFGHWSVTPAEKNLQGRNYMAAVFLTYPSVHRVTVAFYQAKKRKGTVHTFYRKTVPRVVSQIRGIVENAQRVLQDPKPADFTPHPVNCGFCHRVNCPARLKLASELVTAWSGRPVNLPTLNLIRLTTPQLGALKRLTNVFKTFAKAVDEEARRRAFDDDDVVEGYEIVQRSGPRSVIGAETIAQASHVLAKLWPEVYPGTVLPLVETIAQNIEISVARLEQCASRVAPYGEKLRSQQLVSKALDEAKLITSNPIFYLAATRE